MAIASHQLRSIAHKLLTDPECQELKCAVQGFKQDKSVLMLCASLYKILNTPEKTQILLSIYPMIPHNMQADFDSLCCLQFDVYASLLRPEIIKRYGAKSAKRGSPIQNQPMVSIQQLRRYHTPRDCKSPDKNPTRPHKSDRQVSTSARDTVNHQRKSPDPSPRTVNSNRDSYSRRRASPDPSPPSRNHRRHQRQRKRSKTAHAVLGPKPDGQRPVAVESPRVPPLNLNTSGHNSSGSISSTPRNITVRKVRLERRDGESLGFAIRGGTDLKSGIYVSEIDAGGQAERRGLRVGERILKVNDVTFKGITHAEAVACLKASHRLTIYAAPIGHMPGLTPTPRSGCSSGRSSGSDIKASVRSPRSIAPSSSSSVDENKRIMVMADEDSWLGCSIRGGVDLDMEITVANVDHDSPAYKAGLKKGQHIIKVNDVSVATLTHTQVINLITASKVVRFEVKPGTNKKSRCHRRSKTSKHSNAKIQEPPAAAVLPTTTSPTIPLDHPSTSPVPLIDQPRTSPIPLMDQSNMDEETANQLNNTPQNWEDFEQELMSTPPVSSSTPLPPDDHPLLLGNRLQQNSLDDGDGNDDNDKTIANIEDEATIIQMLHRVGKHPVDTRPSDPPNDGDPDETLSNGDHNSTTNNITCYSKFDKGTIKLNMADPSHKDMLKTAKIINISTSAEPAATQKMDKRRRSHVKDIFADYEKPNGLKSTRSESCRTPAKQFKTPQKERSNSLNILGSPYSNVDQEPNQVMSPDKAQLRDARINARIQLKQELTGKRLMLSPNVPLVTPNSPVSNFLRRVKRNPSDSAGGAKSLLTNMSGSLESLGTDGSNDGKKLNRPPGISKWRSAYDFIAKSDSDED